MFVHEEAQLAVSFAAAAARLAVLARSGWLLNASEVANEAGAADLGGFGGPGSAPTMSRLVKVHFRAMIARRDSAGLALRWGGTNERDGRRRRFVAAL
jgi:hypothetical protein